MGVALLAKPPVLLLPGWLNSDESHWQSRWAALHSATPVQQHDWLTPLRGDWLSAFETHLLAAHAANTARHGPHLPRFAVAAHSLGCHLLAAWLAHSAHRAWVVAALVVAPPDLSQAYLAPAVARWAPAVTVAFPPALREATVVLGSDDYPYASSSATAQLAAQWGRCSTTTRTKLRPCQLVRCRLQLRQLQGQCAVVRPSAHLSRQLVCLLRRE